MAAKYKQAFSSECVPNFFLLFFNQNICCGYSKEPSQCDALFEHPKHMLKIMGKTYLQFYAANLYLSKLVYKCPTDVDAGWKICLSN